MRKNKYLYFLLLIFLTSSCSKSTSQNPATENQHAGNVNKAYQVKETFNVGNNVFVRSIALSEKYNQLWVGTSVGALQIDASSGNVLQTFTRDNGLANEYVFSVYLDSKGEAWLGTNGGGVSQYNNKNWTTYFPMHGLADYWVYSFVEQKDTAMWIGTWAGLSRFDYKNGQFSTYLKELVNEWVYGLDIDSQNRIWIGTEGGVNMFDGSTWHVWTHDDGVGALNHKNLTFSTNTGLGTRTRHDLSVLSEGKETYNPSYIFCVKVTTDDTVWVGTWGGGVSFYNGKEWKNYTEQDGLAGNIVYSLDVDKHGTFWFGTNKGLSKFDKNSWTTFSSKEGLLDNHVYAVVAADNGNVWAGTKHGVARLTMN